MLEKIVDIRRILRTGKNFLAGRTLEVSEYIDGKMVDVIFPHIKNNNVKIFGFDSKNCAHIFTTGVYNTLIMQNDTIEKLGLKQKEIYYQKFSDKKSVTHYFDVDYENGKHHLRIIARIKEHKYLSNNKL
jgi:hypothetical protein